jgi:hypothetical protein
VAGIHRPAPLLAGAGLGTAAERPELAAAILAAFEPTVTNTTPRAPIAEAAAQGRRGVRDPARASRPNPNPNELETHAMNTAHNPGHRSPLTITLAVALAIAVLAIAVLGALWAGSSHTAAAASAAAAATVPAAPKATAPAAPASPAPAAQPPVNITINNSPVTAPIAPGDPYYATYAGQFPQYEADIAAAGIVAPAWWLDATAVRVVNDWRASDFNTDPILLAGGIYPQHLALFNTITANDFGVAGPSA